MGIRMGKAVFHMELKKFQDPSQVLTNAFSKVPNLDLLVTILPGKTPFYGMYVFINNCVEYWLYNI